MSAPDQQEAATAELVGGVVGDRCASCQAALAPDQRYCINCGERRGRPRFSSELLSARAAPVPNEPPPPRSPSSRFAPATTLVAGIATLLIAMGVGVLIGHNSASSSPTRASVPEVIKIGGAAGTAGTGPGSALSTNVTAGAKGGKAHVTHVVVTAKAAKAANQAASKVLGQSSSLARNVNQSVGGSCSGGAGCQGGKFTGNFFPGG